MIDRGPACNNIKCSINLNNTWLSGGCTQLSSWLPCQTRSHYNTVHTLHMRCVAVLARVIFCLGVMLPLPKPKSMVRGHPPRLNALHIRCVAVLARVVFRLGVMRPYRRHAGDVIAERLEGGEAVNDISRQACKMTNDTFVTDGNHSWHGTWCRQARWRCHTESLQGGEAVNYIGRQACK